MCAGNILFLGKCTAEFCLMLGTYPLKYLCKISKQVQKRSSSRSRCSSLLNYGLDTKSETQHTHTQYCPFGIPIQSGAGDRLVVISGTLNIFINKPVGFLNIYNLLILDLFGLRPCTRSIYIYIYVYISICIYRCMYIYIYIHIDIIYPIVIGVMLISTEPTKFLQNIMNFHEITMSSFCPSRSPGAGPFKEGHGGISVGRSWHVRVGHFQLCQGLGRLRWRFSPMAGWFLWENPHLKWILELGVWGYSSLWKK